MSKLRRPLSLSTLIPFDCFSYGKTGKLDRPYVSDAFICVASVVLLSWRFSPAVSNIVSCEQGGNERTRLKEGPRDSTARFSYALAAAAAAGR